MKTAKQLLCAVLVVCLLVTSLVPAVLATDGEDAVNVLKYGFYGTVKFNSSAGATSYVFENAFSNSSSKLLLTNALNRGYQINGNNYFNFKFSYESAGKHWYAIQIDGVEPGVYEMVFNTQGWQGDKQCGNGTVYVMEQSVYNAAIAKYLDEINTNSQTSSQTLTPDFITAVKDQNLASGTLTSFDASGIIQNSLGYVTFPAANNAENSFVLVVVAEEDPYYDEAVAKSGDAYLYLRELVMTPTVATITVGDVTTGYSTVSEFVAGVNNATVGTVKLLTDISTAADITLKNGVRLDLNGKTLTVNTVAVAAGGELVYNGGTLNAELTHFTAEDEAAASAVQTLIDALGDVTLESGDAINEADAAYAALTDIQKKLVNAIPLVTKKQAYEKLKADTAAAAPVQAQIDAIGEITLESEDLINEIIAAYAALTDDQKALVDNTKLKEAQKKLSDLKPFSELKFDFGGGEGIHLGWAEVITEEGFIMGGDSEMTERSRYITTSRPGSGAYWTQGAFALKFKTNSEKEKQWFAIQISNVKAGTYDAVVRIGKTSDGGLFKVHILDLNGEEFLDKIPDATMTRILGGNNLTQAQNEEIFAIMDPFILNRDNQVIHNSRMSDNGPADESTGLVTFPEDGNYVLMIQCMGPTESAPDAGKFWANIAGLNLSPAMASVQESAESTPVIYHDAASAVSAISAAPEGAVAKLINDVTTPGNVTVRKGVTLDLNGKKLKANAVLVIAGGSIVYNGGTLDAELYEFTAEEQAPADAVNAMITALGEITLESEAAIDAAYEAYNALTDNQKMLVDILALDAAKATLEQMKIDKAAADAVQAKIDALGEITLESESEIEDVLAAYQALTNAQKELVDNAKLIAAQKKLAELKYPGIIVPDDPNDEFVPVVDSDYAVTDPISSVYLQHAATAVVNGHDYMYMFFSGQVMLVYDLDTGELVDKERNAFGQPRGIYIDEDGIVWACGAGRMLYKYNPYTLVGESIEIVNSTSLFPNITSFNSHGITGIPGTDWLYFGTYNKTYIGAYNKRTGEFKRLGDILTNTSGIADGLRAGWGGVVAKDGYLYLGVDGDGNSDGVVTHEIIKFDLTTNKIVQRLNTAGEYAMGSANWLENFKLVGDDVILGSIWRERSMTFAIDISGDEMKLITVNNLPNNFNGAVSNERNGKVYFMGVHERGLLEYDIATRSVTDLGIALGTPTGQYMGSLLCAAGSGSWVTVDHPDLPGESLVTFINDTENGVVNLVFYNLETKKTVVMENYTKGMGSGNQLETLVLSQDKKYIYTGAYGNNQLGIYDLESGEMSALYPTYSHQVESIIEYGGYVYAGVYAQCSIVQVNPANGETRVLSEITTDTAFYQNRIRGTAAGDGKVFFSTNAGKNRFGGDLMWYDTVNDRVYVAAGPNPEDVYYMPAGLEHKYDRYSAVTGEPVSLDINGDGVEDKDDSLITVNGKTVQRFTGVIENQTIVWMTYKDGYIYGCSSKSGGSGTEVTAYDGNAVLFVYDVNNFRVVATYDLSLAIPGLATPVLAVDSVFEDPDVPGKFWGVVSETLFSFTFDIEKEIFRVNMELSLGRDTYKGVDWRGREILFDDDFMYVIFGSKGTYMINKNDPTRFYRLTTTTPYSMVLAEDKNIYYIDGDMDIKVMYTSEIADDVRAADAVRAQIAAIGDVTLESENAINAARAAYDALTAEQKALVDIAKLTAAEAKLAELKTDAEKEAADKAAVDAVIAKIDAIGKVTAGSGDAIAAARKAYNALTDAQKKLVSNLDVLTDAEAAYEDAIKDPGSPDTGDLMPMMVLLCVLTVSALALTATVITGKKKRV